jgi:hypothetical protein
LSAELLCVDRQEMPRVWPLVEGMLKAATEHCGNWSIGQIRSDVLQGQQLLWITWDGEAIKAAATTRLVVEPDGLICQAVACGGTDDNWPERFAAIEEYARDEGCIAARIEGRPGWARIFRDYKPLLVTLEKRLD